MGKNRFHSLYQWALTVMLFLCGFLLIRGCLQIYLSGPRPFSPETVAAQFVPISWVIFTCLIVILGGCLIDGFAPREKGKLKPVKQPEYTLKKLSAKLDLETCDPALREKIRSCRTRRGLMTFCFWLANFQILRYTFSYWFDPSHFDSADINMSIVHASVRLFVGFTVVMILALCITYHNKKAIQKETELVKEAIGAGAFKSVETPSLSAKKYNLTTVFRYGFLVIAIGCLVYGLLSGGAADVLTKAVNICTECVGLG